MAKRGRPKKNKVGIEKILKSKDPLQAIINIVDEKKEPIKVELTKEQKAKREKLLKIMNDTNRGFKRTVLKFGIDELPCQRILFGLEPLDKITGGGIPCGKFSVVWGTKGVGKTTLAYKAIAEAQKMGKLCAFIDLERSFEVSRAKQFGVNVDDLVLANIFNNAEEAMDTLITMCREQVLDFIVLDSIQALSPLGEQETKKGKEKSIADDDMALLARKLSKFFRVSSSGVYEGNVAVLLIGQARTNLGGFIAFDSLSGGHALAHWNALTIQLRRGTKSDAPTEKVDTGEEDEKGKKIFTEIEIGFQSVIKLEKTKISSEIEGTTIKLPYLFKEGFQNK
jgi:RecA/RadA recombinase